MTPSRVVWWCWGLTRLAVLVALVTVETGAGSDLKYYDRSLADLGADGIAGTMREYPVPALVVLAAPYGLLALVGASAGYYLTVIVLAMALDGAYLGGLLRHSVSNAAAGARVRPSAAVVAWLVAVPAIGSIAYARFDLLPGVLIGLAVLWLVDAPRHAALAVALATGVKYWPALVLPAFAAARSHRARFLTAGAVAGGVLVLTSLALGGWERIVSPLDYQDDRGLQIESVAATPAMLGWAAGPERYDVHYASSLAWEVDGPGVDALVHATTVATLLLLAVAAVLWVAAWRALRDAASALPAVVWLVLAAVSAFIVGGKVLSPQYLLWLLPVAAAGLAVLDDAVERRRLWWWTVGLLGATVLTHVIYPHGYRELLDHSGWSGTVVGVLLVRNLVLVALCGYAFVVAGRLVRSARRRPTGPPATSGA